MEELWHWKWEVWVGLNRCHLLLVVLTWVELFEYSRLAVVEGLEEHFGEGRLHPRLG